MKTDSAFPDKAFLFHIKTLFIHQALFPLCSRTKKSASKQGTRIIPHCIFSLKKVVSILQKGFPSPIPVQRSECHGPEAEGMLTVGRYAVCVLAVTPRGYTVLTKGKGSVKDTVDRYTSNSQGENLELQDFLTPLRPHSSLRKCTSTKYILSSNEIN